MLASIVIPVYNESTCLEENLRATEAFLQPKFNDHYEIVCVDDGSEDGSQELLNGLKDSMRLSLHFHDRNRGKGAAIKTGMLASRGDVVFFSDADLVSPSANSLSSAEHHSRRLQRMNLEARRRTSGRCGGSPRRSGSRPGCSSCHR